MTTAKHVVADADLGKVARKQAEVIRRFLEGALELDQVLTGLQQIIDGVAVQLPPSNRPKRPKPGTLTWEAAQAYLYDLLGMLGQYEEFRKEHLLQEMAGQWQVVMLTGLAYMPLAKLHRRLRINLDSPADLGNIDSAKEQRNPNRDGSYAVSFKGTQEADPENANQSADDRQSQNCQDITVLERLFLGLVYFLVTGKHLDEANATLCSGSRFHDGVVPSVRWSSDRRCVCVCWDGVDYRGGGLRARSVVSVVAKSAVGAT